MTGDKPKRASPIKGFPIFEGIPSNRMMCAGSLGNLSFVCHLLFVLCPSLSVICYLLFSLTGCAAHKQVASRPPLPPTPENAIQVLSGVPRAGYEKLGTVAILQDVAEPANRNFASVRQIAAQSGATAVFIQQERPYSWRSGFNQCRKGRIIVYALIRAR